MQLAFSDYILLYCRSFKLWFGLPFCMLGSFALANSDWVSLYFYFSPVATATGRIVSVQDTNFGIDEAEVQKITYRYHTTGFEQVGHSFTTDTLLRPNMVADLEYLPARPTISRITGTSNAPFPSWGLLGSLFFIGYGLKLMLQSIWDTRRLLAILDDVAIAEATCLRIEPKKPRHDEDAEFVAHYSYLVNSQRYTYVFETSATSTYNIKEPLVFQRAAPTNATLLANLPNFVKSKLSAHRL